MNVTIHLIVCGALAMSVIALFIYRHWLENQEDHYIHLHNDAHDSTIINTQTSMGKRLEMVDKAKNALLIATILYALAIGGMVLYSAWTTPGA
jgi:hypothetical protein